MSVTRRSPVPDPLVPRAPASVASTLAVFAHFDPGGQVAPHVQAYLAELSRTVDRLVIVSSADLTPQGRRALEAHGELVTRTNVGYDFYSWKTGLDHVGDWDTYDRVVTCNDSVAGPVVPLAEVLGDRAPSGVDFWGMTTSHEIAHHAQSWFVVFERGALQSGLVHGFWRAMEPISDRYVVIRRYEIGMSRLLLSGGLRMGSYLRPDLRQTLVAERRYRLAMERLGRRPPPVSASPGLRARLEGPFREPRWNPVLALWDAVLDGDLPFVKIEVLRDDPYRLGREHMLEQITSRHPGLLEGVPEYMERTRADFRRLRGF